MRIPRIHTGQALQAECSFDLEPGPSQHLARALRMQAGDTLILFDGRGGQYPATITSVSKSAVSVRTGALDAREAESPLSIHLGIAISRGDRMDWVVQKATELGVASVSPLTTERTEVKLRGDRADKKLRHWQQVAISACEQCGRNRVPRLQALNSLDHWLSTVEADLKLVLHHRAGTGDTPATRPASIALLIGPEGGLSEAEIASAESGGFVPLQLGPRVLRTETAPLAAITLLQARWGDMGA